MTAVLVLLAAAASRSSAQQLRPLSAADKARLDSLLADFDPNSYDLSYQYLDGDRVRTARAGRGVGLSDVRQRNTIRRTPPRGAGTTTTINFFRDFGADRSTRVPTMVPMVGTGREERIRQIHELLRRYFAAEDQGIRRLAPPLRGAPAPPQ